jgi:5-methyltetrahydrofolate--homocysteine methyltransferase
MLLAFGGFSGTGKSTVASQVAAHLGQPPGARTPQHEPGATSIYSLVPFKQDTSFMIIGERTNANGSKAFREAMLESRFGDCVEIARAQIRDGSHLLDVCIDYVGRDGTSDTGIYVQLELNGLASVGTSEAFLLFPTPNLMDLINIQKL